MTTQTPTIIQGEDRRTIVQLTVDPAAPAVTELYRVIGELAAIFAPRINTYDLLSIMMTCAGDASDLHMTTCIGLMPVPMHDVLRLHALLGQRLIRSANFISALPANQVPA